MDIEYNRAKYQDGFKYQLTEDACVQAKILGFEVSSKFYNLTKDGLLTGKTGYSWDGASSFPDVKSIMRGSLFHDILYQMMRLEELPADQKEPSDRLLQELCVRDGMWRWVAWRVYKAVNLFGKGAAHPNHKRKVYTAP